MKSALAVRISSKPASAQTDSRKPSAARYALLSAAATDVERKKHKKNPFDERYVELCLTSFAEVCNCLLKAANIG